jgi:hypothetical protein
MNPKKEPLVLLVDSDGETLTSLYSILVREGCSVATSHPDSNALRYVAEHKPEVALVGRHPEDATIGLFPEKIRRLSPKTRVLFFDLKRAWEQGSLPIRELVETVKGRR